MTSTTAPSRPSADTSGVPWLLVLFAGFVLVAVIIEGVMVALGDWAMLALALTFVVGGAVFLCAAVVHVINGGQDAEAPAPRAPALTPAADAEAERAAA